MTHEEILEFARSSRDGTFTLRELYSGLGVRRSKQSNARRLVQELVRKGDIVRGRGKGRYALPEEPVLVRGLLRGHHRGFAFLIPDDREEADVFLPPRAQGGAMDGDRVLVRVTHEGRDGKREGRVERIVERSRKRLIGLYRRGEGGGQVTPFSKRIPFDVSVTDAGGARPGMMVEVELTRYAREGRPAAGRVVEVLGYPDEPGVDTEVVIREFGIPDEHPEEAVREAKEAAGRGVGRYVRGRKDLRELLTVTIDGETARDFDDAISLKRTRGGYLLWVHIADVAHYVRSGSALDLEAYDRGTSVYFPDRAVHMLPEALAAGACSLNPGEDRLALTAEMELDRKGNVGRTRFYESVIRSAERMTYTTVKHILVDREPALLHRYGPIRELFPLMEELARLLMERRTERGSLDFDLPEPIFVLDEKGLLTEVLPSERNIAHRIIEEFMIAANEAVARHLVDADIPALHRIHEKPDPARISALAELVATFGYSLKQKEGTVRPSELAALLKKVEGSPEERLVSTLCLRSLARARYDVDPVGHFGLATDQYLHFTSPIRRYPDLVVHRILKAKIAKEQGRRKKPLWKEEGFWEWLVDAGAHCSLRERNADQAERELADWKKVAFMSRYEGDEFDGVVIGMSGAGLFVELDRFFVEGLVPLDSLADDYYKLDDRTHRLTGRRTGKSYRLGDRVRVRVERADQLERRIFLGMVQKETKRRASRSRGERRRPRKRRRR